jgi:alkylation response protein AidB-like acyl-CoA dehydrogenase
MTTSSVRDWLGVVRSLAPRLDAARAQAERDRRFPSALIHAMAEAGLFRLRLPAKYGGAEADHRTYYEVIEAVSRTDASAGWLIAIGNEAAVSAGYLATDAADEIFAADPNVIVAAALKSRRAEVQPVDGGYRLRGQWALASGCPEAAWLGAAYMTPTGAAQPPEMRMLFLPARECRILDTWDALGLRATASHDFVVDDAFVPERRQLSFPGRSLLPGPLWRGDIRSHLGGLGAVALGSARAAIDELVRLASDKTPFGSRGALRERPAAQAKLAQAEALVRSARAFLYEVLDGMWQTQCEGLAPTETQLSLRELAVVHAVQSSAQAVNLLFDAAGSDAVYAGCPLERCFRDLHVIAQHMAGSTNRYEQIGRFLMPPASA